MSVSAAKADAFYREIRATKTVWTIRDSGGLPAPKTVDGQRAQPFWSKRSRAQRVIDNVPAYADFELVSIALDEWLDAWLPGLAKEGLLVGLNWSGRHATGYDLSVPDVIRNLEARSLHES
jgi:hypothetical protein